MWNLAKIIKATAIVCDRNRTDHYSYEETTEAIKELNTQMVLPSVFRLRKKFVMDHERGIDIALARKDKHFDYFVFGHRHLPLEVPLNSKSIYFNLGDWITHYTYGIFDCETFMLNKLES